MAFINDTIANWTPAQLQSFIQSISSVDATQIPTSLNFLASEIAAGKIDNLSVNNKLDLASKVGLTQVGVPIDEGLIMTSDPNSQITWNSAKEWERPHLVTGEAWAGMNYHPSHFTSGVCPSLTNQRASFQLIEITKATNTHGFYISVDQAAVGTFADSGYALYPFDPVTRTVSAGSSLSNGTVNPFSSTGNINVWVGNAIVPVEPGWYYFGVWMNMSAVTTLPQLWGGQQRALNVTASSYARSVGFNSKTTFATAFPNTWSSGDAGFSTFENVIWVGAAAV